MPWIPGCRGVHNKHQVSQLQSFSSLCSTFAMLAAEGILSPTFSKIGLQSIALGGNSCRAFSSRRAWMMLWSSDLKWPILHKEQYLWLCHSALAVSPLCVHRTLLMCWIHLCHTPPWWAPCGGVKTPLNSILHEGFVTFVLIVLVNSLL